jgi:hypothetical protein
MDLKNLATVKADDGVELELRHPGNNTPLGVFVTLLSADSKEYAAFVRRFQNQRLQGGRRNNVVPTADEFDNMALDALCKVAVKGWRTGTDPYIEIAGEKLECNLDNAYRFFGDPQFRDFREQAQTFIDNRSNFLAKSVTT